MDEVDGDPLVPIAGELPLTRQMVRIKELEGMVETLTNALTAMSVSKPKVDLPGIRYSTVFHLIRDDDTELKIELGGTPRPIELATAPDIAVLMQHMAPNAAAMKAMGDPKRWRYMTDDEVIAARKAEKEQEDDDV